MRPNAVRLVVRCRYMWLREGATLLESGWGLEVLEIGSAFHA
jgi:hypothetical protein